MKNLFQFSFVILFTSFLTVCNFAWAEWSGISQAESAQNSTIVDIRDNKTYSLGRDVSPPHLVVQADPILPNMQAARLKGICTVQLVVDEFGKPADVHVIHGISPELDQAILDAVRQYVFRPATVRDAPIPVRITLDIRYNMPPPRTKGLIRR